MAEFSNSQFNKIEAKKQIQRHGKFKIVISIVLALILIMLLWGGIYTTADVNSYRIVVSGKRQNLLSLSFDEEFAGTGFSVLKGLGVQSSSDSAGISYSEGISDYVSKVDSGEIPMEIEKGGQAGKAAARGNDEFIASKFFLKNVADVGTPKLKYKLRINILENHKNALSAVRFLVISDTEGERVTTMYAQPADDGSQEKLATDYRGSLNYVKDPTNPEEDWLCKNLELTENNNWYYDSNITDGLVLELESGEVKGYTICVWYEGSDPNHCNDIIGGYITFNVTFSTIDE